MMSVHGVIFEVEDRIGLVHLNNPKRANALSEFLVKDLREQVRKLAQDDKLDAVIFTGGESKAFCAGADLKERQEMSEDEIPSYVSMLRQTFNEIAALPMPTIAAIKGLALGGGCELALSCDIRVMEESALIGLTEVSWGIIPGAGGTQRLPQLVGPGMAKKLIFTAAKLNGKEACNLGLVEEVCSEGESLMKALHIASSIRTQSAHSVRLAKKAIDGLVKEQLQTGLETEWACYQHTIPHMDRLEGLASFKEKRKPDYTKQV
jgi:enoyl-CoA hydratase/carnithine racemase